MCEDRKKKYMHCALRPVLLPHFQRTEPSAQVAMAVSAVFHTTSIGVGEAVLSSSEMWRLSESSMLRRRTRLREPLRLGNVATATSVGLSEYSDWHCSMVYSVRPLPTTAKVGPLGWVTTRRGVVVPGPALLSSASSAPVATSHSRTRKAGWLSSVTSSRPSAAKARSAYTTGAPAAAVGPASRRWLPLARSTSTSSGCRPSSANASRPAAASVATAPIPFPFSTRIWVRVEGGGEGGGGGGGEQRERERVEEMGDKRERAAGGLPTLRLPMAVRGRFRGRSIIAGHRHLRLRPQFRGAAARHSTRKPLANPRRFPAAPLPDLFGAAVQGNKLDLRPAGQAHVLGRHHEGGARDAPGPRGSHGRCSAGRSALEFGV